MGKATIVRGGAKGSYTVRLKTDNTLLTLRQNQTLTLISQIQDLQQAIYTALNAAYVDYATASAALDAAITAYQADTNPKKTLTAVDAAALEASLKASAIEDQKHKLSIANLRLLAAQRDLEEITALETHYDAERQAWCTDFTENLPALSSVGTMEIPGEATEIIIRPADSDLALYNTARDGLLIPTKFLTPAGAFYNLSLLPGWQKWKPIYRVGVISAINDIANTVDLSLTVPSESSQQQLNIHAQIDYKAIPVVYMRCNSLAFRINDRVIVQFTSQNYLNPTVIGFEDNPRGCSRAIVVLPSSSGGTLSQKRLQNRGDWTVSDVTVVAGTVDWRGAYEGNTPTKVLSWYTAEHGRNLPSIDNQSGAGAFPTAYATPSIWQDGALLSTAPGKVLGAALTSIAGAFYIIAAVISPDSSTHDRVYRRPVVGGNDSPYDPGTNPNGWRQLGDRAREAYEAPGFYFFNGSGTEGQSIRTCAIDTHWGRTGYTGGPFPINVADHIRNMTGLRRVKCVISGDVATFSYIESTPISYVTDSLYVRINGSYVIGVDYIDDQEILLTFSVDGGIIAREVNDPILGGGAPEWDLKSYISFGDYQIPVRDFKSHMVPSPYLYESFLQSFSYLDIRHGIYCSATTLIKRQGYSASAILDDTEENIIFCRGEKTVINSYTRQHLGSVQAYTPNVHGAVFYHSCFAPGSTIYEYGSVTPLYRRNESEESADPDSMDYPIYSAEIFISKNGINISWVQQDCAGNVVISQSMATNILDYNYGGIDLWFTPHYYNWPVGPDLAYTLIYKDYITDGSLDSLTGLTGTDKHYYPIYLL
jgi:hypothetical protein